MNREVKIKVTGWQTAPDGSLAEPIVREADGLYYLKNHRHYLIYDEIAEEGGVRADTHCVMKFTPLELSVKRTGPVNAELNFHKDRQTKAYYETPFGNIEMEIESGLFHLEEEAKRICFGLDYTLKAEGSPALMNRLLVEIEEKE
ncbi:MAG: DUF1934 domain-containing protein [Eubacterium sp.]|nr:DUF1934 domain-containing protein [Eubacterium sp.]